MPELPPLRLIDLTFDSVDLAKLHTVEKGRGGRESVIDTRLANNRNRGGLCRKKREREREGGKGKLSMGI